MKKEEIIERIIDTFTDMGCESPEDTAAGPFISLDEAATYLAERRGMEQEDLNPEDWFPAETTPEMYMEAYNCYVRRCRHEVQVKRLAEFLYYGENVDVYDYCVETYGYNGELLVYPTEELNESIEFPFTDTTLNTVELIVIGQNSPEFNPDAQYCYFDAENNALKSTDHPFEDKLIDPVPLAEFIINNRRVLEYVRYHHMDNAQYFNIFEEDIVG